ncbi:MAG TPA: L-threonylcarbamoyladenylate synthase, partial [Trueperaceae bacterium]
MNPDIHAAADILRAGGLVAFPTETVYGLGADAANPEALAKVFAVKGRPTDHPLIVHLASPEQLDEWAEPVPELALRLVDAFWPGPLTLILRRAPGVLDAVTGGQDTVGLRVPRHPVARELLRAFGGGVAAPSANRFGRISPTTAAHVRADLGERVDAILDGGPSEVGLESTILDLSSREPRILRPGGITAGQLAKVLGQAPAVGGVGAPRVSGSLASHYAPRTPSVVVRDAAAYARHHPGRRLGVLARRDAP